MRQTENYGFNIPEENEFYDVELENENWRKLDAVLKEISDKLDAVRQLNKTKSLRAECVRKTYMFGSFA